MHLDNTFVCVCLCVLFGLWTFQCLDLETAVLVHTVQVHVQNFEVVVNCQSNTSIMMYTFVGDLPLIKGSSVFSVEDGPYSFRLERWHHHYVVRGQRTEVRLQQLQTNHSIVRTWKSICTCSVSSDSTPAWYDAKTSAIGFCSWSLYNRRHNSFTSTFADTPRIRPSTAGSLSTHQGCLWLGR